jgi:hypothetical protein
MNKYVIQQYPANKDIDQKLLSGDQIILRERALRKYEYGSEKKCNTCGNIEYIAWSALDKGRSIFKCSNCNASELTPIPGEIT